MLALDRIEQQQELIATDPRQHVGLAQIKPEPLCDFHQQCIPDRMAVIVVDVLEIVDVQKCECEPAGRFALQQAVGAIFDHTSRRQIGQFVIVSGAEQMILDGLLFADVRRSRKQQIAVCDTNRPMGREKDLFDRAAGYAFFCHRRPAGAKQFKAGFAAVV